jgi:hypothetical protein
MIEGLALWIGLVFFYVGGTLLFITIMSLLVWQAFEVVATRVGWAKSIHEWAKWKRQQRLGG